MRSTFALQAYGIVSGDQQEGRGALKVTKACSFLTEFASEVTKTISFLRGSAAVAAGLHANWGATAAIC